MSKGRLGSTTGYYSYGNLEHNHGDQGISKVDPYFYLSIYLFIYSFIYLFIVVARALGFVWEFVFRNYITLSYESVDISASLFNYLLSICLSQLILVFRTSSSCIVGDDRCDKLQYYRERLMESSSTVSRL